MVLSIGIDAHLLQVKQENTIVRLTVAVPGGCPRRQSAFVPRRPLPLAPLPVSAPGGGRVAPYLLTAEIKKAESIIFYCA